MQKYLTYKDDKSDKFWKIEVNGSSFTLTHGITNTIGKTQIISLDSEEQCMEEAKKLVTEKLKKGYKEQQQPTSEEQKKLEIEKIIQEIKKAKSRQLVIKIREEEEGNRLVSFLIPRAGGTFEETSSYIYDLKRPTYYNLQKIINENKNEPYLSDWIADIKLEVQLESTIKQCEEITKKVGYKYFKELANLKFSYPSNGAHPAYSHIQHLFWAGDDKCLGEKIYDSDVANKDGSINWASEVHRIKEECKDVILQYFEEHPDEEFESLTIDAVEHVGILINDGGSEDSDYCLTNIYSPDIEYFVHNNGMDEYHNCIDAAIELLKKDKEMKRLFTKSTEININT